MMEREEEKKEKKGGIIVCLKCKVTVHTVYMS